MDAKFPSLPIPPDLSDVFIKFRAAAERCLNCTTFFCALFNFMNRLVEGTGCSPAAEAAGEDEHEPLQSYLAWGEEMGFAK